MLSLPDIKPRCATCPYMLRHDDKVGICRRNPPAPFFEAGPVNKLTGQVTTSVKGQWPPVGMEDWCGEHPMLEANRHHIAEPALSGEMRGQA